MHFLGIEDHVNMTTQTAHALFPCGLFGVIKFHQLKAFGAVGDLALRRLLPDEVVVLFRHLVVDDGQRPHIAALDQLLGDARQMFVHADRALLRRLAMPSMKSRAPRAMSPTANTSG